MALEKLLTLISKYTSFGRAVGKIRKFGQIFYINSSLNSKHPEEILVQIKPKKHIRTKYL